MRGSRPAGATSRCSPICACRERTASPFCGRSKESDPDCPVIVMTAFGTIENAVEAMKLGAYDFVQKPVDVDHLLLLLRRCREYRELRYENILLKDEFQQRYRLPAIVGESPRIVEVSQCDSARRADRFDRAAAGRVGHRQGAVRARDPSAVAAARPAVRRHQLRRDSGDAHRERAVRTREGLVHRRDGTAARQVRAGRQRHDLPRRDRRPRPRRAVEASARDSGAALRPDRRHVDARRRRAHHLRDEPRRSPTR